MKFEQGCLFEDNPEYDAFTEKFKPKKTTDDCYTPPLVYDAIRDWACGEYGIDPASIVRPFYPGGDYERFDYPDGCVVLDNPPFSILSKICEFYIERGIAFFLFAPSLTVFSGRSTVLRTNHIICDADITYENGAVVSTAFITSYGGNVAQTAPELRKAIERAMRQIKSQTKQELPKYKYPDHVLTAAMLRKYAHYGVEFAVKREDCTQIEKLDSQRPMGKKFSAEAYCYPRKPQQRKPQQRKPQQRKLQNIYGNYQSANGKLSQASGNKTGREKLWQRDANAGSSPGRYARRSYTT